MEDIKYALCQNCSTVHYVVSKETVLKLQEESNSEFSKRNLKHCSSCGMGNKFIEVSEENIDSYLSGSEIPAIYLENAHIQNPDTIKDKS
jgi:hypothetical protein